MTYPILTKKKKRKKKRGSGGERKERGKVEGAEINQLSICGSRKRSAATTTTCLHPQWTELVITHMGGRGWHSLHSHYRRQDFVTGNLLQFRQRREWSGILPPESPGVWDTDSVLAPLTQTHLQQLASKWRHSYLCCSPYCGFPFKKRPFTAES